MVAPSFLPQILSETRNQSPFAYQRTPPAGLPWQWAAYLAARWTPADVYRPLGFGRESCEKELKLSIKKSVPCSGHCRDLANFILLHLEAA